MHGVCIEMSFKRKARILPAAFVDKIFCARNLCLQNDENKIVEYQFTAKNVIFKFKQNNFASLKDFFNIQKLILNQTKIKSLVYRSNVL